MILDFSEPLNIRTPATTPLIDPSTMLAWLQEAEDDIGDLARMVETLAANLGFDRTAKKANDIAHKWEHRRNKRDA